MQRLKTIIGILATTLLCASCTTAEVKWSRLMRTLVEPHDAVAVVASRQAGKDEELTFVTEATSCIATALNEAYPALKIIRTDEFYRTAFPDLPAEEKPNPSKIHSLPVEDPDFRERIARLGLHYLITVTGDTTQHGNWIGGIGGGGPGAVTWIGKKWDRSSNITASILDLRQSAKAGEVLASASGEPWLVCVGALFICAPIGAPALTETKACDEIATGVVKFFAGESPAPLADTPTKECQSPAGDVASSRRGQASRRSDWR